MADQNSIRVAPFAKSEYTLPDRPGPMFTWKEFYGFRNEVIRILKRHGTIGPMGEMPILESWDLSNRAWEGGDKKPDFFVVDDMWNDRDRWTRVETAPWFVNSEILREIVFMLQTWPGWCVYFALEHGGLTVLGDRILYDGGLFDGAASPEDLGNRCARVRPSRNIKPV